MPACSPFNVHIVYTVCYCTYLACLSCCFPLLSFPFLHNGQLSSNPQHTGSCQLRQSLGCSKLWRLYSPMARCVWWRVWQQSQYWQLEHHQRILERQRRVGDLHAQHTQHSTQRRQHSSDRPLEGRVSPARMDLRSSGEQIHIHTHCWKDHSRRGLSSIWFQPSEREAGYLACLLDARRLYPPWNQLAKLR